MLPLYWNAHCHGYGELIVLSGIRLKYNPALDGLRAVAIVLVFLSHAHVPMFDGAFYGVDLFFVLSGYLITSLLLKEYQQSGRLNYGRFYLRRFLRLGPALLLFLAVYWLVAPQLWPDDAHLVTQDVVVSGLYLADYGIAFFDSPDSLLHMWSLAVEEHYYLIWPPLLALLLSQVTRRRLWLPVLLLTVLMFVWRMYWIVQGQQEFYEVFFRFDTRATGMLLGSLLAVFAMHCPGGMEALYARRKYLLWTLPAVPFLIAGYEWGDMGALLWGGTVVELAAAAIIIAVSQHRGTLYDMLSLPGLVWLGRISYGIYLWHYPIVRVLRAHMPWEMVIVLGLPISTALAALSFYTIERWALRLRDRRGHQAVQAGQQASQPQPEGSRG